jgi:hypothetical protein
VCVRLSAKIVGPNPAEAWIFVCCVLSGKGLCDGLITCLEESYRLFGLEASRMRCYVRRWAAAPWGGGEFGNFMLVGLEKDEETFVKRIRGARVIRTRVGWNGLSIVCRGGWTLDFNRFNPSGYYMYHQFNIQQFYVQPTQTVFMSFVWISEQTAIISLYSIDWLVFITERESVYCAVRAKYWTMFQVN